jgi:hypothetical protein
MGWVALIVCGLLLGAASGGIYAMGREIWPSDMAEAVRLAAAPVIASAVTVADKIAAPDSDALFTAAAFTLIAGALDGLVLAPLVDRDFGMVRSAVGFWLPLGAIFFASLLTGVYGPL